MPWIPPAPGSAAEPGALLDRRVSGQTCTFTAGRPAAEPRGGLVWGANPSSSCVLAAPIQAPVAREQHLRLCTGRCRLGDRQPMFAVLSESPLRDVVQKAQ